MQPDVIPYIYKPTGKTLTDSEGNEYPEQEQVPGFHVNFPEEVPEIAEYLVDPQPATPYRIYAGGRIPVAYVFPDERTFKQHFPDNIEDVVTPVEDSV